MTTPDAFATAESGSDYFATEVHYRALADRIVGAVNDDRRFIVVTGDPPPSPHTLSASLDEVLARQRPAMVLTCEPQFHADALSLVCRSLAARAGAGDAMVRSMSARIGRRLASRADDAQPSAPPSLVFIFDDAGQLSDRQIEDIYEISQSIDYWTMVMLGRSDLLARLERPTIRLARDKLASFLRFQELGPLEILPYIRHQLGIGEMARVFTDDAVAVLRVASRGDPRIVNRLARRLLDAAAGTAGVPGSAVSPSPAQELARAAPDQPPLPDPAPRSVAPEASLPKPDAATAPDLPAEVPPSADEDTLANSPSAGEEAEAVPLRTVAPRLSQPGRRHAASAYWPAIAAVFCLVGAGLAGAWILHLRGDGVAPAGAGLEGASSPTRQAASSTATGPTSAAPPAIVKPEANAAPAPPPAAAEPPHLAPSPKAKLEATAAPTASPSGPPTPAGPAMPSAAVPAPGPAPSITTAPTSAAPPAIVKPEANAAPAPPPAAAEPPHLAPSPKAKLEATAAPGPSSSAATEPSHLPPPPTAKPEATAAPTASPSGPPTPAAPPAVEVRPVAGEVAALLARGDELFGTGDVASARLFYERAADAGDARAALRLGESFDPGFLEQAHVRGARGDPGTAISWYRRARELGSADAEILLKSLEGN